MEKNIQMSIFSQEGYPVNQHLKPGSVEAQKTTAGSGQKLLELYEKHCRHGVSLRTCVGYLLSKTAWSSKICYLNWKATVTKYNRLLFQLAVKMPHIEEIESGFWPTPTATERSGTNPNTGQGAGLSKVVKFWPTPRANKLTGKDRDDFSPSLHNAVKMFPTPRTSDAAGASMNRINAARGLNDKRFQLREVVYVDVDKKDGSLNPQWVEWLMGYPLGHTDLKDSETP